MKEIQIFKDLFKRKIIDLAKKIGRLNTSMDMVILTLKVYNIFPKPLIALDLFGMYGLWVTVDYAPYCDYLEMWEINPKYAKFAHRFLPKAVVNVGDSIKVVKAGQLQRRDYNFIVIDNPIGGVFDERKGYCEHFDLFPEIFNYIENKRTILVMNSIIDVGKIIEKYPAISFQLDDWLKRRKKFFNKDINVKKINPDILEEIYENKFKNWGVKVNRIFFIPRDPAIGFLVIEVEKK